MIPIWGMLIVLYIAWYLVSNTLPACLSISKYFFLSIRVDTSSFKNQLSLILPFWLILSPQFYTFFFSSCSFSLLTILESQIPCQLCDLGKVKLSSSVLKNGNNDFTPQGSCGNYIRNLHLRRVAGT